MSPDSMRGRVRPSVSPERTRCNTARRLAIFVEGPALFFPLFFARLSVAVYLLFVDFSVLEICLAQ